MKRVLGALAGRIGGLLLVAATIGCSSGGPTEPACATGDFVLTLTRYDDDVGRLFELRVFEARLDDNREFWILGPEVDSVRLGAIPRAEFSVTFCLVDGVPYIVEYYADHDGDGRYGGPPDDHTGRLGITGGESGGRLTVGHLEPFPELDWP